MEKPCTPSCLILDHQNNCATIALAQAAAGALTPTAFHLRPYVKNDRIDRIDLPGRDLESELTKHNLSVFDNASPGALE
jgi:hypothetical protein